MVELVNAFSLLPSEEGREGSREGDMRRKRRQRHGAENMLGDVKPTSDMIQLTMGGSPLGPGVCERELPPWFGVAHFGGGTFV